MKNNYQDSLLIPKLLVESTNGLIRSHLERSHIAVEPIFCPIYETGEAWDVGCCLGYRIYARPEDVVYLKNCNNILSRLGHDLSRFLYAADDKRPYGFVNVVSHLHLINAPLPCQVNFLDSCWMLDYSNSMV
ncbi:hypothetical protein RIVM261_080040 [Rivularia sp. IAM M-261]|nr:hypothetical protein RIVM261_080040 [Rivularia sp. IAM M-261]